MTIAHAQFEIRCQTPEGDAWSIYEHLPTIRDLADECESAYELGVHKVTSTWAFLAAPRLKKLISVDRVHPSHLGGDLALAENAAKEVGKHFQFIQNSTLNVSPEPVDLTFIDTWHVYDLLMQELERFAPTTRKYIVLHDTETFGTVGEDRVSKGLRFAVDEFLGRHPEWYKKAHYTNNNGLTVLARRETETKKKNKVMAVTGYVFNAFPARHLSPAQFNGYGERLKTALGSRLCAFDQNWTLEDLWAYPLLKENPGLLPSDVNPPTDRYPSPKDAAISNLVLLQRYEWMRLAAELHRDVDVFAWVEYSVLKQQGVTEQVILDFLDKLEQTPIDAITLPGEWDKKPINDSYAHWRFAGSCWICPRPLAKPLAETVKTVATMRTKMTGKVSWDMNTMAYVELLDVLPIRWYRGGHNETQFTGFGR